MRKLLLIALLLLLGLVAVNRGQTTPVVAVSAIQSPAPVLLQDDFESYALGPLPAPWIEEPTWYRWRVMADPLAPANGVLATTSHFEGQYVALQQGELTWGDQQATVRWRWNGDTSPFYWGVLGVRLNADRSHGYFLNFNGQGTNRLRLQLTRRGYTLEDGWINWDAAYMDDKPWDGRIDPTQAIYGLDVGEITPNRWYTLALRAQGNQLRVFLDGTPVGPLVIDRQAVAPTGRIGVGATYSPTMLLDDLLVEEANTVLPVIQKFSSVPAAVNGQVTLTHTQPLALSWQVTNAQSVTLTAHTCSGRCTVEPANGLAIGSGLVGALTHMPGQVTTYTLWAIDSGGTLSQTIGATRLPPPPDPVAALHITPTILPDGAPANLHLGVAAVHQSGLVTTVTDAIQWQWAPPTALTVTTDGAVTFPAPLVYSGTVAITATVGDLHDSRLLYLTPGANLLTDSGFESDSWWSSWTWDGDCARGRTDAQAHQGQWSFRLRCSGDGRVGVYTQPLTVPAGVYRLRGYLRGLNIAPNGLWGNTTELLLHNQTQNLYQSQRLLTGSFGWTPFEATYHFTETTTTRFYVRLWASGSLWLDDLTLTPVAAGEPVALRFGAAETSTPSPCEEATPGSCLHAPTPVLTVTHFADATLAPFIKTSGLTTQFMDQDGYQLRVSGSGYLDAWAAQGLPTDWLGYDYLTFEVENEGSAITDFYVEIRDHLTSDYWSRVNWYDVLAPGRNRIRIPLQIFVGERIQVNPSRRLDLSHITRLVLSFPSAGHYRLSAVRLEEEPFKCSRPDWLHAFDFGIPSSPVLLNFEPVVGDTAYAACRGYGLQGNQQWRTEDRRHPDPLYRDWISFDNSTGSDFAVDLAPGSYQVEVSWEDAGFWEYYQHYSLRSVLAEGQEQCRQTETAEQYLNRYYRFEHAEDLPDTPLWSTYIAPRYQPSCRFTVTVSDGQLNLDFQGDNPYAAAINGVVVYPVEQTAAAQQWLAGVTDLRHSTFDYEYRAVNLAGVQPDPAALRNAFPQADWVLFQPDPLDEIFANSVPTPTQVITGMAVQLARDERTALTVALYPFVDLGAATSLTVEGLPAGVTADTHYAFYKYRRATDDGTVYASRPHLLRPVTETLALPAGLTRQFWLGLTATDSARPGRYAATVRLQTNTGAIELPLTVTVLPITLPQAPVRHSLLGSTSQYPGVWNLEEKMWRELPTMLDLLQRYGMTALTGPYLPTWNGTSCNVTGANRYLAAIAGRGFAPVINTYSGANTNLTSLYNNPTGAQNTINCALTLYQSAGYSLTWSLYDEPGDLTTLQSMLDRVQWFDRLTGLTTPPGFLAAGYQSVHFADPTLYALQLQLFQAADYPFVTLFDENAAAARQRRPWGIYNINSRFGYGYYAWALHKHYGLSDVTAFALQSVQSDPYYDLDSREADHAYVYTTRSGALLPTLKLERLALGINDFRYLAALEAAIADAHPDDPAVQAATAFLTDLQTALPVTSRNATHSPAWFTQARQAVIAHLLAVTASPAAIQPGDGNGDGQVDAGDITACVLEIFDGDGAFWLDAPGGTFPGTTGCDANADTTIDAGDITCTVLLIFDGAGACGDVAVPNAKSGS